MTVAPLDEGTLLVRLLDRSEKMMQRLVENLISLSRIEAEAGLPAITGDRHELLQPVDNLLGNALRYGRPVTPVGVRTVKHIVERHRGRLKIESEVGRGTDAHVLLPVAGAGA